VLWAASERMLSAEYVEGVCVVVFTWSPVWRRDRELSRRRGGELLDVAIN